MHDVILNVVKSKCDVGKISRPTKDKKS